ncbi:MAG TPA: DinB family protein [Terriglobales bacterium]|jgi:hypothetical protein|nr:DinB family protein [Terriglobales bacterium]
MNATSATSALNPELADDERQIAHIKEQAAALVRGLSDAQYNWHPGPGQWSMAQCLAHIVMGNEAYFPVLEACISEARKKRLTGNGPFHYGWFGNWFVRSMDAPPKRRFKNPPRLTPPPEQPLEKGATDFNAVHDRLQQIIVAANGVDLARAKFRSPLLKLLKLSLGQGFGVLLSHARRHLWQANEVRKHPDFPKS